MALPMQRCEPTSMKAQKWPIYLGMYTYTNPEKCVYLSKHLAMSIHCSLFAMLTLYVQPAE